jgi:hypothetical protein
MLRRQSEMEIAPPGSGLALAPPPVTDSGFPGTDQPCAAEEHPAGILFYHGKLSFFLPYHLLQTMRYEPDKLTLVFATDNVELSGRGLHALYVQLARQKISRIVEQGERYAAIAEDGLCITRLNRVQRTRDKKSSSTSHSKSKR